MDCPDFELLHAAFLQTQISHNLGKGWLGNRREVGRCITELVVEASHERAEEELVGNLLADVAELVRESFQARTKLVNG